MRSLLLAAVPAAVGVLLSGCADRSTTGPTLRPSFDFTNGPANPGPIVFRFKDVFGVFYADPVRGLSAIHGGNVVEFCNTGGTAFQLVDIQHVLPPQEQGRIIELLKGKDLETTVWPFVNFDCGLFTTITPLATGVVDLVNTDNDLLVFLRDTRNVNAYGFTAQGRLTRPSGAKASFNSVMKVVWDGVDGSRIFKATDFINLR
jgi:hypothetical protein